MVKRTAVALSILLASTVFPSAALRGGQLQDAEYYKNVGDQHASKEEDGQAAEAYEHALSLGRDRFMPDQRVRMAVYLSWDNRLKQAIRELELIALQYPENEAARIELARIYSWDGQLKRAEAVANGVLGQSPDQSEALLVKANALEWNDRFNEAIEIYKRIIERDGNFDAKLGLTSSLFHKGDRAAAQDMVKSLRPAGARQQRQLQKLSDTIDEETRPRLIAGYEYYSDSDHNHFRRYSASHRFTIGNQNIAMNLDRLDSDSGTRADSVSLQSDFNASGPLGLDATIGIVRLRGIGQSQFPTGRLRLHGRSARTSVNATVSTEVLSETSTLIGNEVRKLSTGVDMSQRLTSRWTLGGAYSRLHFSDTNAANDGQLRTEFALKRAPRVALGYQVRYLDFNSQSGSGFFDPSDFVSHRASGSIYLDRQKFYTFLQVYGGHQRFVRHAFRTSEWVKGVTASLGLTPNKHWAIEFRGSGGDFATGSVSGFRYLTVGSNLSYRF